MASGSWLPEGGETRRLWWRSPAAAVSALPLICFGFQCHLVGRHRPCYQLESNSEARLQCDSRSRLLSPWLWHNVLMLVENISKEFATAAIATAWRGGLFASQTFSLVYDSLANPTPQRIDAVAFGCMALCAGLYITMGIFGMAILARQMDRCYCPCLPVLTAVCWLSGYLLLGDKATADVLADLHAAPHAKMELDVAIARACVAVKVACSCKIIVLRPPAFVVMWPCCC